MIIQKFYKAYFILFACLLLASFAQSQVKPVKDSIGIHAFRYLRGDTISIEYDTAYLANNKTFKIFQVIYENSKNNSAKVKMLEKTYDSLVTAQQTLINEKEKYYQQLKSNFDSVIANTNTFVDKTDANVNDINQSLTRATGQLNEIKLLLDDSLAKLKTEHRQRLKIAIGGFAVGVGIASLIFLVAK